MVDTGLHGDGGWVEVEEEVEHCVNGGRVGEEHQGRAGEEEVGHCVNGGRVGEEEVGQ